MLGLLLLLAAMFVATRHLAAGLFLIASSGFVLFEAGRGWCAVRACGIKTRF